MKAHYSLGIVTWMIAVGVVFANESPSAADDSQEKTSKSASAAPADAKKKDTKKETQDKPAPIATEKPNPAPEPLFGPPAALANMNDPAHVDLAPKGNARPGRIWVKEEYLLWWTRGQLFPPLVTTSPLGTPLATAALLG